MENKIYIVEMCESGELHAFSSEEKAKKFMLKSCLNNNVTDAQYCVEDSTNVYDVVDTIKTDIECILKYGYLEDVMYMFIAKLDKEVKNDE